MACSKSPCLLTSYVIELNGGKLGGGMDGVFIGYKHPLCTDNTLPSMTVTLTPIAVVDLAIEGVVYSPCHACIL